jgi:hypothetical protein
MARVVLASAEGRPVPAGTVVARVVVLNFGEPPAGVTHWTGRAMARAKVSTTAQVDHRSKPFGHSPPDALE